MKPILIDVPMPLTTSRLILRPPAPGDGAEINAAVQESLAELQAWMPWAGSHQSVDDSEANARVGLADFILRKDLRMSIFERASGRLVGSSGLHRLNWDARSFELGYWVRRSFAGKGMITEATAGLTLYAFQALAARRVEIRCDADNERSIKIPRRLGFQLEGRLHSDAMKVDRAEPRDTLVFARFTGDGLPDVEARWDRA